MWLAIYFLIMLFVLIPISIIFLIIYFLTQRKIPQRNIPQKILQNIPQNIPYMDKGKQGEYLSYTEIIGTEQGERILNNLYIPVDLNKKADIDFIEIDLILINSSGIYILESKNYNGWIFGNEVNKYWTQSFKSKKVQFYNPIWQNNSHIKAVMNVLNLYDYSIYKSIIVFGNQSELKDVRWHSPNISIVKRYELRNKIISYMSKKVFTTEEVDRIYYSLLKYTYINQDIIANHVSQVNKVKLVNGN